MHPNTRDKEINFCGQSFSKPLVKVCRFGKVVAHFVTEMVFDGIGVGFPKSLTQWPRIW